MAFRLAHFLLHDLLDWWQPEGARCQFMSTACKDCEHDFTIIESLKDHEGAEPNCPECKSSSVERVIGSVHVQTGKKS